MFSANAREKIGHLAVVSVIDGDWDCDLQGKKYKIFRVNGTKTPR